MLQLLDSLRGWQAAHFGLVGPVSSGWTTPIYCLIIMSKTAVLFLGMDVPERRKHFFLSSLEFERQCVKG